MKLFVLVLALFLLSIFGFVAALQALPAEDAAKSDTWLQAQLVTTYGLNDTLNSFPIEVHVNDGVAQLSGVVSTDVERELAVEIAKGIDGIKQVKDNIQVDPGASASREKSEGDRSLYRNIENMTVTAKIRTKLMWDRHTDGLGIDVKTDAGVVKLQGQVPDAATRDLVVQIAKNTSGVRKVLDELTVAADSDNATEPGPSGREKSQPGEAEEGRGEAAGSLAERVKGRVSSGV